MDWQLYMMVHGYSWLCMVWRAYIVYASDVLNTHEGTIEPLQYHLSLLSVVYHLAMLPWMMGPAPVVVHVFFNLSSW